MKSTIHKFIYNPQINRVLRFLALIYYKAFKKKLISISGTINLDFEGQTFKLATNQTNFVTQELFYDKAENYEFTKLFSSLIKKSNVFFDIGSNIGYFSILGSQLNPSCAIFACEPSVGSLHYLELNKNLNKSNNLTIVNKAIANSDENLTFHEIVNEKYPWLKHNLNGSNSLENKYINKKFNSYEVEVTTIDKVVSENQLISIDLIKIDTECTEHLILASSIETINKFKPIIICEVYPVIENEIEKIIFSDLINYEIFQFVYSENKLKRINSILNIAEDDDRNFIFCPNSKVGLIKEFIL